MSKFHSIVNRRDFMKGLGLVGAGIGATALATPQFHDLDEVLSAPQAKLNRAWYVKQREFGDIGIELDWSLLKRRNQAQYANWTIPIFLQAYPGGPQAFQAQVGVAHQAVADKRKQLWPNYEVSTRDLALAQGLDAISVFGHYADNREIDAYPINKGKTPEELGVPKWQGTPEENLLMVRAFFSLVGLGPSVGVAELNTQTKNFVWDVTPGEITSYDGKEPDVFQSERIIFDDNITEYYRTRAPNTLHIPSSHKYVISTHNVSCDEIHRRVLSGFNQGTEGMSYTRVAVAKSAVQGFMRGLGYNTVFGHKLQPAPVWDFLDGVGQPCRMGQVALSPEVGGLMRTHAIFYTDLPLAFTPPVDAGLTRFCDTCGICAETCPVGAIPKVGTGRSWDNGCGQNWADDTNVGGTKTMYNLPGYKGWRVNEFICTSGAAAGCGAACKGSCPFNTIPDGSFMHSVVKSTVSTTPIFNSFFKSMEQKMQYGYQDKEPSSWWNSPKEWHVYGSHPNMLEQ